MQPSSDQSPKKALRDFHTTTCRVTYSSGHSTSVIIVTIDCFTNICISLLLLLHPSLSPQPHYSPHYRNLARRGKCWVSSAGAALSSYKHQRPSGIQQMLPHICFVTRAAAHGPRAAQPHMAAIRQGGRYIPRHTAWTDHPHLWAPSTAQWGHCQVRNRA